MKTKKTRMIFLALLSVLIRTPVWAADVPMEDGEAQGESLTEVNKKLTNPVSELWSISFQQNNYVIDMGPGRAAHWNSSLNVQPVMPVSLTDNWNLITRSVVTVLNKDGDVWTVPLGLGLGKVQKFGRLPIRLQVAGQYMARHPKPFGQEYNIQFTVSPVIPKLIKGSLFEN